MTSSIIIGPAQRGDIDTIAAFNVAMAFETEHKSLDSETVIAGVGALLERPEYGFYLVANRDQRAVGCLMVTSEWSDWRNGLFWWIQSVYVLPDQRRGGVFRTLYQHARRLANDDPGVCGLRLYVERANLTAQHTYHALGMQETPYLMFEEAFS